MGGIISSELTLENFRRAWHYAPFGTYYANTIAIVFALARPTLVAFGLVSVSYHWNNFFWPLIVTNTPQHRPLTVGLVLFAKAVEAGADWSLVTAGTVIVILPLLGAFIIFQRQFINSFMRSGVKWQRSARQRLPPAEPCYNDFANG